MPLGEDLLPHAPPAVPLLDEEEVRRLGEGELVVREGALGEPLARAAHRALQALAARGALTPAGIGRDGRLQEDVRADHTAWLEEAGGAPELTALWLWFDALRQALVQATWLALPRFSVQLACYPSGGAHYARHLDALPGDPNRRLTAIVYLNPAWQAEHGGQLRAWTPHGPVDVAPTWDRLVMFRSDALPHAVLPAWAARYAATAWFRGPEAQPLLPDPQAVLRRVGGW